MYRSFYLIMYKNNKWSRKTNIFILQHNLIPVYHLGYSPVKISYCILAKYPCVVLYHSKTHFLVKIYTKTNFNNVFCVCWFDYVEPRHDVRASSDTLENPWYHFRFFRCADVTSGYFNRCDGAVSFPRSPDSRACRRSQSVGEWYGAFLVWLSRDTVIFLRSGIHRRNLSGHRSLKCVSNT